MAKLICLSALLFISNLTEAQYQIVDNESLVKFSIKNFGISTGGSFSGIQGKITFDINQLNTALFEVSIDANRVNTGNESRDNHLRNEDYFNVKKYPRIYFVSNKVAPSTQKGTFIIFGKLTIKINRKKSHFHLQSQRKAMLLFSEEISTSIGKILILVERVRFPIIWKCN
jgi:polyisoprenoid-binding protein YceI